MEKNLIEAMEIARVNFIQIPGPNPILKPGSEGEWDGSIIESCNVFKDQNTYYLYYHGKLDDKKKWPRTGYRIGVATASHPLGPWRKYEGNPIIDLGPEGSWEDQGVACAAVLKEEGKKYYMWYSGTKEGKHPNWSIGLATSSNPLGPWEKYKGNPILENFGYVGGVVKVKGKYYMYSEYPIGSTSPDQGPIALAIAERPEGPWEKHKDNPVISPDGWGFWDDGGFSEAGVVYHDGIFHIFYGGTKWEKLESIGYAYSTDGYNFIKYSGNPVALRERNPDASAFAEVHAFFEPPFVYLYHTLRYISRGGMYKPNVRVEEDIGVQILATAMPFRLAMPVLSINSLSAVAISPLEICPPISLEHISDLAITAECTYHPEAKKGLKVHVRASHDGVHYDTEDLYTFDNKFKIGQFRISKTVELAPKVMFIKVIVENLDKTKDITNVKVTVTLGG